MLAKPFRGGFLPLAIAAALLPATALHAQDRVNGRTVYPLAFFETFAPATALQIVQRVPGFRLEEIDQEVRGFAQAAGNVVINGARPSAKSDKLETILSRIPANRGRGGGGGGGGAGRRGQPATAGRNPRPE